MTTLFHVYHDDGDEEDVDLNQVEKGIHMFENDVLEQEDEEGLDDQMYEYGADDYNEENEEVGSYNCL